MVIVHFKKGEDNQFLYETTAHVSIDTLSRELASIQNTRVLLTALSNSVVELANHGPARNPDENLPETMAEMDIKEEGSKDLPRTGEAPNEDVAETLKRAASEAQAVLSPDQVAAKALLALDTLKEAKDRVRSTVLTSYVQIKGAIMIAYPQGLPPWDPSRVLLEIQVPGPQDCEAMKELYDPDTAVLWWASKELHRDKKLLDYVGRNEKTKVLIKMQKKGQGMPTREPPIDPEAQKSMMSYWHRKQEEEKRLAADDSDKYLEGAWADPNSLKRSFVGIGDIRAK